MSLKPGTFLGQYEILALLGVGGMGEVYHARDSKLTREVALKVLPEHFARDPERILRFRREAQLLAQLNHQNIAILYNFEETASARFLVMEYVPGETLRERIKHGPVPIEEALTISKQIAEALEHAHEKPIIHRDLKPANVKVTPEGQVKVLDFGLAKAFAGAAQPVDPNDIPTGSRHGTLAGTILGTPAYMSPEQARGKETDKRTDIWSFGCVLFELLTGQWVFQSHQSPERKRGVASPAEPPVADAPGSDQHTVADILGAVMHKEPDWTALPPETPPGIRTLLRRCLEKDAKRRLRDAADAGLEIEEALAGPVPAEPSSAKVPTRLLRRWALQVGAAGLALGILVGGLAVWNFLPTTSLDPRSVTRFTVAPPSDLRLADSSHRMAFSPEGTRLALVLEKGNTRQLYVRSLDQAEAVPLPGTELANNPFFSPDGRWIAFTANRELKKVSVEGGSPQVLTQADWGGGDWGPDDTIIYTQSYSTGIWRVSASGGTPEKLTEPDRAKGELGHWWPQRLPDGETVLFTNYSTPLARSRVATYSLKTRQQKVLVEGAIFGRYLPTGHIVYFRSETLLAAPFDASRLELTGPAAPVLDDVAVTFTDGVGEAGFSATGTLAYIRASSVFGGQRVVRVDRKGNVQPITEVQRSYRGPRVSPDGRRIAVAIRESGSAPDIWTYDLERGTFTRVTFGPGTEFNPLWTRDGRRLIFTSEQPIYDLHWKSADGTGADEVLLSSPFDKLATTVSPDGKFLVYSEDHPNTARDIWLLPLEGDPSAGSGQGRKPSLWLQTPFQEAAPALSPDGRWLAYVSNESRRNEVYVQPFPGPGERVQVSVEGGSEPLWAPDGRQLFYRSGDSFLAVPLTTGERFTAGRPVALFQGEFDTDNYRRGYDVTPDGQSFIMVQRDPQAPPVEVQVVLNWFEELKRRVPIR